MGTLRIPTPSTRITYFCKLGARMCICAPLTLYLYEDVRVIQLSRRLGSTEHNVTCNKFVGRKH